MPAEFVQVLDAEIAELEASLEADPRFKKLSQLRRVRELYDRDLLTQADFAPRPAGKTSLAVNAAEADRAARPGTVQYVAHFRPGEKVSLGAVFAPPSKGGRRASPVRARALVAVSRYLRGRAEPTRTADLLAHLDSLGIPIGGQDRSERHALALVRLQVARAGGLDLRRLRNAGSRRRRTRGGHACGSQQNPD
jgi:hypothetical protein